MSRSEPYGRDLSLIAWGDTLRRTKAETRRRQRCAALVAILCGAVLPTALRPPTPRLLWNVTASAPLGLYVIIPAGPLSRGDLVVAHPPIGAAHLAAQRHYLPLGVPLVKVIAALPGDTICSDATHVAVDGKAIATRLAVDAQGRNLPLWRGCQQLTQGHYLLLNAGIAQSFDGRYFGASDRAAIIGKARPLWLR